MFYNPGGPGELASKAIANFVQDPSKLDAALWERFDIVGVDLRGTGFSNPIKCNGSAGIDSLYPVTEATAEKLLATNRAFRKSCIELTGSPLFDYMDTVSIVHDHEAVRLAIGGEKITWLGQSYGTQLGSQWAELYPNAFRAVLLDAVSALGQPTIAGFVEGAASVEAIFEYFLEWCGKQNTTTCPLAHQEKTPKEQWQALLEKASNQSDATLYAAISTALGALYQPAWPASQGVGFQYLAEAIYNATKSIPSPKHPEVPGAESRYNLSSHWGKTAVSCCDRWYPDSSWQDWQYKKIIGQTETPLMQGISPAANFAQKCAGLTPPTRNPPHPIHVPECEGFPTICRLSESHNPAESADVSRHAVMVGNEYDSATPMANAVLLREQIGKHRARYYPRKGAGHTVYFQPDAQHGEAWNAMNRYLLELELPDEGTVFQS